MPVFADTHLFGLPALSETGGVLRADAKTGGGRMFPNGFSLQGISTPWCWGSGDLALLRVFLSPIHKYIHTYMHNSISTYIHMY